MDKYFSLDPDEGSWFLYISDLTETQQAYIREIYDDLEEEDDEDDKGNKFKFFADVPGDYYGNKFSSIMKYLLKEGFKGIDNYNYGY